MHGATFGSAGSNSDTDRITALWRTTTGTPIIDNILYQPYGPFRQYNQMNTVSGSALRTKVNRNLAYRVTETRVETQSTSATQHAVAITEDHKGRVIGRDYTPNITGLVDSYFVYDGQDRVLCERQTPGTTCPTSYAAGDKNRHASSPPFTAAGDWKILWRPIIGSTGWINDFRLATGTHRIALVVQSNGTPTLGTTTLTYDTRGNRNADDNSGLSNDQRTYTYDSRGNVINVAGKYRLSSGWNDINVTSAFDAQNRRVYKSTTFGGLNITSTYFFYYDALSRLSEIRYTPNVASPSTYTMYELTWLGDELIGYWQTTYPSVTTSKRYVGRDESGRPIDMMSWPASGDAARVWAINPDAWGNDTVLVAGPFQPILFAGQYQDFETVASFGSSTATRHRPGLVLNGFRTYDPWTGSYLQVDPMVGSSWSSYVYVSSDPVGKEDPRGLLALSVTATLFGNKFWTTGEVGCWSFNTGIETSECLSVHQNPWSGFGFPEPYPPWRPRRPHCEANPTDPDCQDYTVDCNVCENGCNVIFELSYCECIGDPFEATLDTHSECNRKLNEERRECLFDCLSGACAGGGVIDFGDQTPPTCLEWSPMKALFNKSHVSQLSDRT